MLPKLGVFPLCFLVSSGLVILFVRATELGFLTPGIREFAPFDLLFLRCRMFWYRIKFFNTLLFYLATEFTRR